ncbi:hypothetical protein L1787_00530 [Acuticoccus sp. M5D2P5]|uniref:tetratricopeptide repeat protein n=1 Tax=Acuticoccus kalidii TaxID=2910977 RepID=UPI001F280591|nr:tetratricopeptide repeat protein [Acuticoccus kalidii]MCF3931895.1 hypothetical protein [Acuticoccus kalidii]
MMRKGARPSAHAELERLASRFEEAVKAEDWDEAVAALDGLLVHQPGAPALLYNKAVALRHARRAEEAVVAADAVLSREPRHVNALFERACALMDLGRFSAARDGFERFLSIEPYDIDARLNLAALLLKAHAPEAALARVAEMPGRHAALVRAEALRDLGRTDEMETVLTDLPEALASKVRSLGAHAHLSFDMRRAAASPGGASQPPAV